MREDRKIAVHNWMSLQWGGGSDYFAQRSCRRCRRRVYRQTRQATIGRENNVSNTRIQSGTSGFCYDRILSACFFSPPRNVISIFFIGICTDTNVLEAVLTKALANHEIGVGRGGRVGRRFLCRHHWLKGKCNRNEHVLMFGIGGMWGENKTSTQRQNHMKCIWSYHFNLSENDNW